VCVCVCARACVRVQADLVKVQLLQVLLLVATTSNANECMLIGVPLTVHTISIP
jgi:hypothetical protein